MKSYSKEIKLLLNEIAILSQPQQIDGKLIYEKDTLKKLRSLSARLYMLCDFALEGNLEFEALVEEIEKRYQNTTDNHQDKQHTNITQPVEIAKETPPQIVEVKTPEPVVEIPVEIVPPPVEIPVVEQVKPAEPKTQITPSGNHNKRSVDDVVSSINISRRFEYINFLFGGDSEAFRSFLNSLSEHGSLNEALDYFETNYNQRNWSRKSETAGDLKKIIQNLF